MDEVYTDGASSPKRDHSPGGWAWVHTATGEYEFGSAKGTTNQRMEMQAVIAALKSFSGPLRIFSDSAYIVNCYNQEWWRKWLSNWWRTSAGKSVANQDLWDWLIEQFILRKDLELVHVRGHSGDYWNEVADRYAVEAKTTQTSGRGVHRR